MADEWHYTANGSKTGPVSGSELKRLADAGLLTPGDLVWKAGMAQWLPAKGVKGLFNATKPTPVVVPPQAEPSPRNVPARVASQATVWHPLDHAVGLAREACPSDLPGTLSALAGNVGIIALYVAAAVVPIGGAVLAIKTNNFAGLALTIAASVTLIVGQYVAQRLLGACDAAIHTNKTYVSSLAIPDCLFVAVTVGTIGGVVTLLWLSIQESQFNLFLAAIALLVVGVFAALVAIQPSGISVFVRPECRAAEEAVGVLTFLMKFFLRCAPIAFAAAVAFGTFRAISLVVDILRMPRESLLPVIFQSYSVGGLLLAATAIPLYAYLIMLIYYLSLDIISAIVSIPGKLDLIANQDRATDAEDK